MRATEHLAVKVAVARVRHRLGVRLAPDADAVVRAGRREADLLGRERVVQRVQVQRRVHQARRQRLALPRAAVVRGVVPRAAIVPLARRRGGRERRASSRARAVQTRRARPWRRSARARLVVRRRHGVRVVAQLLRSCQALLALPCLGIILRVPACACVLALCQRGRWVLAGHAVLCRVRLLCSDDGHGRAWWDGCSSFRQAGLHVVGGRRAVAEACTALLSSGRGRGGDGHLVDLLAVGAPALLGVADGGRRSRRRSGGGCLRFGGVQVGVVLGGLCRGRGVHIAGKDRAAREETRRCG